MKYFVGMLMGVFLCAQAVWADDDDMVPTIEVSASASVSQDPDQAVIQLSVETFAKTALEATQENAKKMNQIRRKLKRLAIRDTIRTTNFQVEPQYDYKDGRQKDPRPIGYRVHNTIEVEVIKIKEVGAVVDGAISAGANRVMGLTFQIRDSNKAYQQALQMAMQNAKEQAESIAQGAGPGVNVGDLLWVSTSGRVPAPVYKTMRAEAMMASDTSISSGALSVVANVRARYRISHIK